MVRDWFKQHRKSVMLAIALVVYMLGAWALYAIYGHRLVQDMYQGRSVWPLNGISGNQGIVPLQYYLEKADGIFLRLLFLPLFSFFFYKYLFKAAGYFFKKNREAGSELVAAGEHCFRHDWLIAVALYLFCTWLFFYPCLRNISTYLIGPPGDNMEHFWDIWWWNKAAAGKGLSFSFSDYIFYPEGSSLLFHATSFYNFSLAIPLSKIFNRVAVYNILILHSFLLAGVGAFLLIRYITRDSLAGIIGGFIFAFSPFHFVRALCHLTISSIQFIPFFVLYYIKSLKGASRKDLLLACLFFFLNGICSWYSLVFSVYFMGFVYLYLALRRRQALLKDALLKSVMIIGITLLILSPWILRMILLRMKCSEVVRFGYDRYLADVFGLFVPHPLHWLGRLKIVKIINQKALGWYFMENTVYLGLVNILIIVIAFKAVIKKTAGYFLGLLAFLLIAMGTFVHILGWVTPAVLPYAIIRNIPILSFAHCPSRIMPYVYLFLAVITAFSLRQIIDSGKRTIKGKCLVAVLVLLLFFDYYSVCRAMTRAYMPACYNAVKKEEKPFGILDLPVFHLYARRFMMYQTYHGFPIVQAEIARKAGTSLIDRLEFKNLAQQKNELIKNKVKYIVIHKDLNFPPNYVDIRPYAEHYRAVYADDHSVVFQVY